MTDTISEGLRTVAQHDLNGYGDGMQVMREGDAVYVGCCWSTTSSSAAARRTAPAWRSTT